MNKSKCGRERSNSDKLFTQESLAQHEKDCPWCNGDKPRSKCGRVRSKKGKLFTDESLARHEKDCPQCNGKNSKSSGKLSLLDTITGDENDGVYFAIAHGLGYW